MANGKNFASSDVTKRKNSEPAEFFQKKVVEEIVEELVRLEKKKRLGDGSKKDNSYNNKKQDKKVEEKPKKNGEKKTFSKTFAFSDKEKIGKSESFASSDNKKDSEPARVFDKVEELEGEKGTEEFIEGDFEEETSKPKVLPPRWLETGVVRKEVPLGEENEREVNFSNDYSLRLQGNQIREDREGVLGFDSRADEGEKQTKIYDPKERDESSKTFYDNGGRDNKKDIYSPEMMGDRGDEKKFIHGFGDLEKKSEETTMGGFGIATKRRKGEDDKHYDNVM